MQNSVDFAGILQGLENNLLKSLADPQAKGLYAAFLRKLRLQQEATWWWRRQGEGLWGSIMPIASLQLQGQRGKKSTRNVQTYAKQALGERFKLLFFNLGCTVYS